MHLPAAQLEVDRVVGEHPGEAFGDPVGGEDDVGRRDGGGACHGAAGTTVRARTEGSLQARTVTSRQGQFGSPVTGSTPVSIDPSARPARASSNASVASAGSSASWKGAYVMPSLAASRV